MEKAIDIVKNAKKVEMARYADYQYQFPFKNSSENKIATYTLWVSQNGENLEIITDSDKYVKLTKQDSENLYEILIGEKLIKSSPVLSLKSFVRLVFNERARLLNKVFGEIRRIHIVNNQKVSLLLVQIKVLELVVVIIGM